MKPSTYLAVFLAVALSACATGDERCGDNQVLGDGVCQCASGYEFDDDLNCVAAAAGRDAGAPDASQDEPDAGAETVDAGSGDDGETLGKPCTSHDDCGEDAPFCDTYHYQMCVISDCTIEPETCPGGYMCCDFVRFGLDERLCVYDGECPTR